MTTLQSTVARGLTALASIVALSLVLFTHERELTPLYGSFPTNQLLKPIALAAATVAGAQPFKIGSRSALLAAIALTLAPNATYYIAALTARFKNAFWGPAVTHLATLAPLVFLIVTPVVEHEEPKNTANNNLRSVAFLSRLLRVAPLPIGAEVVSRRLWSGNSALYPISDSQIYLALAAVFYNMYLYKFLWKLEPAVKSQNSSNKGPKVKTSHAVWNTQTKIGALIAFNATFFPISSRIFANPVLPHPLLEPSQRPGSPLQILSAEQSVTGLITVAEWFPPEDHEKGKDDQQLHSTRYLRASHSILGGVWTHDKVQVLDDDEPPVKDSAGNYLGDSIYSAFVLQEAARLVNSTPVGKSGEWSNALIVGLGAGISATAFMRHGLNTTIVEIDPAVYRAAREYFGLPDPGPDNVYLQDARAWAAQKKNALEARRNETQYDIVVHDCFSGGGVPQHIFTSEFWDDLKAVMNPEAILAVNFAGLLKSDSSRLVINTLEKSFGQCRAFHDMFDPLPEDKYDQEFINMASTCGQKHSQSSNLHNVQVIFCTRSPNPLTFRKSRRSDWLSSPLRRHVLRTLPEREVNLNAIRETPGDEHYILTDKNNPLGALQDKQGSHHWEVMREVLPDSHWETF